MSASEGLGLPRFVTQWPPFSAPENSSHCLREFPKTIKMCQTQKWAHTYLTVSNVLPRLTPAAHKCHRDLGGTRRWCRQVFTYLRRRRAKREVENRVSNRQLPTNHSTGGGEARRAPSSMNETTADFTLIFCNCGKGVGARARGKSCCTVSGCATTRMELTIILL